MNSLERIKKWRKREEHFIKVGASEIFDQQIEDIDWLITEVERLRNGWDQWSKQNRETDYQHRHREWALKEARCNRYAARASYKEQSYLADQVKRLREQAQQTNKAWRDDHVDLLERAEKAEAELAVCRKQEMANLEGFNACAAERFDLKIRVKELKELMQEAVFDDWFCQNEPDFMDRWNKALAEKEKV